MRKLWFMLAMMVCILASCSDGGNEEPVTPTPKPEEVKTEITIDSGIISNGLSFGVGEGEQSVSISVNADWTLSIAETRSGTEWCTASPTSGGKGTATVKFKTTENTEPEDRSVAVTIKAGTASKTFTITQKGADALLVTTNKYEVAQEGGQIEIEVKANIDYQMEISEDAKKWISEVSSRALTTHKHTLDIAMNEDAGKREGEIIFKSGDKVETVKVYQTGGAILLLSQNEYTVSDAGENISVDVKSNVEYGVQMPDVDWIKDEASSRGMSSHTLKYIVSANETYDSRSAEIIFYDKNSDLKDTLKVIQVQKDAIVISKKNINVAKEGRTVEVKINTNVDFEVQIPSDVTWISQTDSRALTEKSIYLKVAENTKEKSRSVNIIITNKECMLSDTLIVIQQGNKNTEAVDLGLSIRWARCNLGAVNPHNYGNYYSYGEVNPKSTYTEENWDSPGTLKLFGNNDAATYQLGSGWRMPTKAEVTELLRECSWTLTTIENSTGYQVTGKTGYSIFLPLTGSWDSNPSEIYENYEARYRTSEAYLHVDEEGGTGSFTTVILELQLNFSDTEIDSASGWKGHPIRPVLLNIVGRWEDLCKPACYYVFEANGTGMCFDGDEVDTIKWKCNSSENELSITKTTPLGREEEVELEIEWINIDKIDITQKRTGYDGSHSYYRVKE